jgi:hypothetical protein
MKEVFARNDYHTEKHVGFRRKGVNPNKRTTGYPNSSSLLLAVISPVRIEIGFWLSLKATKVDPVRNSSGALNLAGMIIKPNPATARLQSPAPHGVQGRADRYYF